MSDDPSLLNFFISWFPIFLLIAALGSVLAKMAERISHLENADRQKSPV